MTKSATAAKTTTAKKSVAKISIGINPELIARLIKLGRKNTKADLYKGLAGAKAIAAIEADAQVLCDKAAAALAKATNDVAKANTVISLLDNARTLNFKTTFKPEAAPVKAAAKPAAKAAPAKAVKTAAKPAAAKKPVTKAAAKSTKATTSVKLVKKPSVTAAKLAKLKKKAK